MPRKVHFYLNSTLLHFTQLITGLEILHQRREIDLRYSLETRNYPVDICRIDLEGKMLLFDMADSSSFRENIYEDCDFYIKRMLLKRDYERKNKLIPFGFNYMVFYENKFMQNLIFNKKYFKYAIRYNQTISGLLNIKNSIHTTHLNNFRAQPTEGFKILFRSRLWNPENNSTEWKKKEREKMNRERIAINHIMKDKLGDAFEGGIEKDKFSMIMCPDLLLPSGEYHKEKYFKLLKDVSIGIVNPGLEDSIGWKFGEYVAHGLAILTTPIDHYAFPGEFKEGENYLCFLGMEDLVEKIQVLYSNTSYRKKIQDNNIQYYKKWLEPAAKIKSIFEEIYSY